MSGGSIVSAACLAQRFPWSRYRTFFDIGAAQGCVPVQIALTHGHLRGGGFDLPVVEKAFVDYVRSHGLSGRLHFVALISFAIRCRRRTCSSWAAFFTIGMSRPEPF